MTLSTAQLAEAAGLHDAPKRIVSLVPSLTELVCDLGVADRVVGCTKFCVHPASLRKQVQVVGGTKNVDVDKVTALRPDLVIASKEENIKEQVEMLSKTTTVWLSDITSVATAGVAIKQLGAYLRSVDKADAVLAANQATLTRLQIAHRGTALYLIWREPYMSVGGDTYIHSMLEALGYTNASAEQLRYPSLTPSDISALAPQHILLSSEPYPFREKHLSEMQALCPTAEVQLVDGELFSWYGSRLGKL